nr:RNA-dependent RNA polymerase, eukaryotic-type [Tanacetum cinerariifolium]
MRKLEDVGSVQDSIDIMSMKTASMFDFEAKIWAKYGRANCEPSYRVMVRPFLNTRRSHLQRELGNEKVLIVQFTDDLDPDMPFDQQSWIATHQNTSDKNSIGFRITWRTWIKACLESSPTIILVNGSLTSEYNVRRGLRQGDPLSPFVVHHHYRGSPRGYFGFVALKMATTTIITLSVPKIPTVTQPSCGCFFTGDSPFVRRCGGGDDEYSDGSRLWSPPQDPTTYPDRGDETMENRVCVLCY